MNTNCAIIIPIYQNILKEHEIISLTRCIEVLGKKYDIIFLKHDEVDIFKILSTYNIEFNNSYIDYINYDKTYFNSVTSFNNILIHGNFYNLMESYNKYKYVLLYELDGFVFYDNLQYWIDKDYDYIGSFSFEMFDNCLDNDTNINFTNVQNIVLNNLENNNLNNNYANHKYHMNGGVSLRKISYFIEASKYIYGRDISANLWEDILFSLYSKINVKFPVPLETFDFCWSYRYSISYNINNFKLPMFLHYYNYEPFYYNICKKKFNNKIYNNIVEQI